MWPSARRRRSDANTTVRYHPGLHERAQEQAGIGAAYAPGSTTTSRGALPTRSSTITDGHLAAVKALARWQHPTLGVIGPDGFTSPGDRSPCSPTTPPSPPAHAPPDYPLPDHPAGQRPTSRNVRRISVGATAERRLTQLRRAGQPVPDARGAGWTTPTSRPRPESGATNGAPHGDRRRESIEECRNVTVW
jgi:hypothetical protein